MTITPELLAAYADGELDAATAAEVEAAIIADPALAATVAAHQALRARLATHYAPILDEPLPERLRQAVAMEDRVVDLASARAARGSSRARWTSRIWPVGAALAASLLIALAIGGRLSPVGEGGGLPTTTLAALDREPSGGTADGVRILLSFVDRSGQYCRVYVARDASGIACRADGAWRERWRGAPASADGGELRQAGSPLAEAFAQAQAMSDGEALDATEEAQAITNDWR